MDPLTHTLVGASLAATRLGATTRRATVALVVGANLPDLDVLSYFAGSDAALGFRRGWTHGVLALVILPAVLALILRTWRSGRGNDTQEPALSSAWLVGLCYLAVLTHPFLDWLNTYGMRWLMPFDSTWYYGDAVFIMDPWIWLVLGTGWLVGRQPRRGLLIAWVAVTSLLLLLVVRRAPEYVPAVVIVLGLLLLALVWRPGGPRVARRAAEGGLALAALFISAMLVTHEISERVVRTRLEQVGMGRIEQLMVGPTPVNPFVWEFVARAHGRLRHGQLSWLDGGSFRLSTFDRSAAGASPLWAEIEASDQIPGFLDWARFPWLHSESPDLIRVLDARYAREITSGFGGTVVRLAGEPAR